MNAGTIRFNNNADTAPTALRANPVALNSGTASLTALFKGTDVPSSLRLGTLSGSGGLVEVRRTNLANATLFDSADLVITTLNDGTFAGTVRNSNTSTDDSGNFIIRGTGNQTFTGTLDIAKDTFVSHGATLTLAGSATLTTVAGAPQTKGSITLNGGAFQLDNTGTNIGDRLRESWSNRKHGAGYDRRGHVFTGEQCRRLERNAGSDAIGLREQFAIRSTDGEHYRYLPEALLSRSWCFSRTPATTTSLAPVCHGPISRRKPALAPRFRSAQGGARPPFTSVSSAEHSTYP